ncbi:MAG TPA: hypothetical protein VM451_06855 [Candidatus Limnocylindria bacterium]|nr:hypothetical protein [Candidatus Limnocylindria bacterium]
MKVRLAFRPAALLILVALAAACSSPGASVAPTSGPPASVASGITLQAPAEAAAAASITVAWTGSAGSGDYLVIVPVGTTSYVETTENPYINASIGNPATLVAPTTPGSYEIWFVKGDTTDQVKARTPLKVT